MAILTALTLRAVFRLAYRQAEGLIGSIISLLGLTLRVPDHTTLSRRSSTLAVLQPQLSNMAYYPQLFIPPQIYLLKYACTGNGYR